MHSGGNALQHRSRFFRGAYAEARLRPRSLPEGNEHLRVFLLLIRGVHIAVDSDDLPCDARSELGHTRNNLLDEDALVEPSPASLRLTLRTASGSA